MKPRELLIGLCLCAIATACASSPPPMYVPSEEEMRACEAKGGTIEPAHALNQYVCLLPAPVAP